MLEVALAVRTLLALVFLTAGIGKFRNMLVFQGVVVNYRLLPEKWAAPFALGLPVVEIIVAAGLLFAPSSWVDGSAAFLLLLFAGAMAINIRRGRRHIDCGCFQSAHRQTLNGVLVARNVGLAGLLAVPALAPVGRLSPLGAAEALATGTVLFVLLQSLNVLWSVTPSWRRRAGVTTGADK